MLLLDWYYSNERAIPVDLIHRIVKARSGPERKAVDEVVSAFFDVSKEPGFAHHNRANLDLSKYKNKSAANSLIAKERESTKRAQSVQESCASGKPSHKPLAISHKEAKTNAADAALFAGVSETLVRDFLAIRKAKRLPLTATATEGLQREAKKAGLTVEAMLRLCCERGWGGFEAKWLDRDRPAAAPAVAIPAGGGRREL